jgi:acyl-CoA synthetase (AMP-forming)/AMP-acid ligase II
MENYSYSRSEWISTAHTRNFVELLKFQNNRTPDKVAFRFLANGEDETETLTYGELDERSRAIASRLQDIISPGDRALLIYPSGLNFITAFFGCLYAGVVAVPAYPPKPNRGMEKYQSIVSDAQLTVVLTTAALTVTLKNQSCQDLQMQDLEWLTTDEIGTSDASHWKQPLVEQEDLAFLQYTSGSTGTPKGVMISHRNLIQNSAAINHCFQDTPDSVGVSWLPPYHDMGLIGSVLQPIYVGATMVLMPPLAFVFKPFRWLNAISKYGATTSGGPNFAYDLCVQKITEKQRLSLDLARWDVAFTGAEPIRSETLEKFYEMFRHHGFHREAFYPCYGMAETTLIVSGGLKESTPILCQVKDTSPSQDEISVGVRSSDTKMIVGCGTASLNLEIAIVDPISLKPCESDKVGEIWVRGSSVAQGYWNREEETSHAFNVYYEDQENKPFFRTGDLGFLHCGELFVTGRLKDIIIIHGCNYYPQDIELTVESSHLALKASSSAAFAIDIENKERLVIVQEVERSFLRDLDSTTIISKIRQGIAEIHSLSTYAVVLIKPGSIPRTTSGKVKRFACKAMFSEGTLKAIDDWSENPRTKVSFQNLEADIDSTLIQVKGCKNLLTI